MSGQVRRRVLFVSERESTDGTYAVYCSHPWDVLGHLEITPANMADALPVLPSRLGELIQAVLSRKVCRAIGVGNVQIQRITSGTLYLRPVLGREDEIIPLLRQLTGQTEESDPKRPDGFDLDDLMAELLNLQLFRPRPHA